MATKRKKWSSLTLCEIEEYGVNFKTGNPVNFVYTRNTEKSGYYGNRFDQDIEPAGRYLTHNPTAKHLPSNIERGKVRFDNPLVLPQTIDKDRRLYGVPGGWKQQLYSAYKKKGRALTCQLRRDGFDGIVTRGSDNSTGEIVDLTVVKCKLERS